MTVRLLPSKLQNCLRSGIAIASCGQCIEELVLNSVDADATCVAVRINLDTFKFQVIDNGSAAKKKYFLSMGERYATSKCSAVTDLDNISSYGFRGEALASIIEVSRVVKIESRAKDSEDSLCKVFSAGKVSKCGHSTTPRPCAGMTITVEDFFYNLPVRRAKVNKTLDVEDIRLRIARIALMHPLVSFSLQNECNNMICLKTQKADTLLRTFSDLFGITHCNDLSSLKHKRSKFTIEGYVSTSAFNNKSLQFIYVNKRPVLKSKLHKYINHVFSKLWFTKDKLHESQMSPSTSPSKCKHAIFILNVVCPFTEYDICFEPAKTLVEFKNWDEISLCIHEALAEFIRQKINLVSSPDHAKVESSSSTKILPSQKDIGNLGFPEDQSIQAYKNSLHSLPAKRSYDGQIKPDAVVPSNKNSFEMSTAGDSEHVVLGNVQESSEKVNVTEILHNEDDETVNKIIALQPELVCNSLKEFKQLNNRRYENFPNLLQQSNKNGDDDVDNRKSAFQFKRNIGSNFHCTNFTEDVHEDFFPTRLSRAVRYPSALQSLKEKSKLKTKLNCLKSFSFTKANSQHRTCKSNGHLLKKTRFESHLNSEFQPGIEFRMNREATNESLTADLEMAVGSETDPFPGEYCIMDIDNQSGGDISLKNAHNHGFLDKEKDIISLHEPSPVIKSFPENSHVSSSIHNETRAILSTSEVERTRDKNENDHCQVSEIKRSLGLEVCKQILPDIKFPRGLVINSFVKNEADHVHKIHFPILSSPVLSHVLCNQKSFNGFLMCLFSEWFHHDNFDLISSHEMACFKHLGQAVCLQEANQIQLLPFKEDSFPHSLSSFEAFMKMMVLILSDSGKHFTDSQKNSILRTIMTNINKIYSAGNNLKDPVALKQFFMLLINENKLLSSCFKFMSWTLKHNQPLSLKDDAHTAVPNLQNEVVLNNPILQHKDPFIQDKEHFISVALPDTTNTCTVNSPYQTVYKSQNYMPVSPVKDAIEIQSKQNSLQTKSSSPYLHHGNNEVESEEKVNEEDNFIGQWCCVSDISSGKTIYVHRQTGHTTFIAPSQAEPSTFSGFELGSYLLNRSLFPLNDTLPNEKEAPVGLHKRFQLKGTSFGLKDTNTFDSGNSKLLDEYEKWENPVFPLFEKEPGVVLPDLAVQTHNIIYPHKFQKSDLNNIKVINQVDRKFISCLMKKDCSNTKDPHLLVLFDQHAIHERIRLEQFLSNYKEDGMNSVNIRSSAIDPPIKIALNARDISIIKSFSSTFCSWGFSMSFCPNEEQVISIHSIPNYLLGKDYQKQKSQIEKLFRDGLMLIQEVKGVTSAYPKSFLNHFNSLACHGAIKFGDLLSISDCETLFHLLQCCNFPFQCAHGRPSLVPLVDLNLLRKREVKVKKKLQFWKLRTI